MPLGQADYDDFDDEVAEAEEDTEECECCPEVATTECNLCLGYFCEKHEKEHNCQED